MGNQQPSTLEERIWTPAKNARLGDGNLWKHPNGVNYKAVFTSTTPELLEVKLSIAPEVFGTGIREVTNRQGIYANAKPLYYLASRTHHIFTEAAKMPLSRLLTTLTLYDLALWYLDDGSLLRKGKHKGKTYYRYIISIGPICANPEDEEAFRERLCTLFGPQYGSIRLNNSRATERNKIWVMPKSAAMRILPIARQYGVLLHKFPPGEGSTTIPYGSREVGLQPLEAPPTAVEQLLNSGDDIV